MNEYATTDDDSPVNIESTEGLNGTQIKAAIDLLSGASEGRVALDVATELLTALGIENERAKRMIASQRKIVIAEQK